MTRARVLGGGALAAVAVALVVLLGGGDGGYLVKAELENAGGLRPGFKVRVDGVPVGEVTEVELGRGDLVTAQARIEDSAAPLGRDARATVRALNILGEKYLDIQRGDVSVPSPSGVLIPASRTGISVELDDVIDTLDLPTRAALNVLLNEGGRGLAGRGDDLAAALDALPGALDRSGELLRRLGADNRALGRLIERSDRVVARVATERAALGRMVSAGAATLDSLGAKHRELAATVRTAPATLVALRRALAALEGAAIPLRPAARGLRATAPALTATLQQLPGTATAARPALKAARAVAPALGRLGTRGTPVVRRLRPLAAQLATFASSAEPGTRALNDSWADVLGVMEGWARSTAPRDGAGHIFRLAVGGGADLLAAVATGMGPARKRRQPAPRPRPADPGPVVAKPKLSPLPKLRVPEVRLPRLPDVRVPAVDLPKATQQVDALLDYLLAP